MALTREQIQRIARLAHLSLEESELPAYQESLSRILDFVGELERAETRDVAPMAHPLAGTSQRLRPDEVIDEDRHEKYQRNAARVEAGLYLVPKVIE